MYTNYIIYPLLIILLLWGGKPALRGRYHDDFMSLEVTKSLRGFAAMGVILHHIALEEAFKAAGQLQLFVNIGYLFVAVFFFCSGYGLMKNQMEKPDYLRGFLSRRVLPVAVAFFVSSLVYGIFHALRGEAMPAVRWITGLLGLTMLNEYAWFPVVITVLYLAFYLLFRFCPNRKVNIALLLVLILAMGGAFAFSGHFAWWAGKPNWWLKSMAFQKAEWWMQEKVLLFSGEWWVNSTIAFLLGLLFAEHEGAVTAWFRRGYPIHVAVFVLLTVVTWKFSDRMQAVYGYWSEYGGLGPGIGNKYLCFLAQIPQVSSFVILLFLLLMKYHAVNPVSRFFGKVSLETYMMNLMPVLLFRRMLYRNGKPTGQPVLSPKLWNLTGYALAVIAATILFALVYRLVNRLILKALSSRKPSAQ